jgi:AraC-like DNA-binding protein
LKVALEQVELSADSSFRLLLTPGLNDYYYWHFHPEYEIVFVTGASGTRHIGDHISRYEGSDLVLIGPYIPHLNFDDGVRTQCEQVVVQMKEDFMGKEFMLMPEMQKCRQLFENARTAIAFSGETKKKAGGLLMQLSAAEPFERMMLLLRIFGLLASSEEYENLATKPLENLSDFKEQQRMQRIHRYVEDHYQDQPDTHTAASLVNLSTAAFCRYFKKSTKLTFTDYVNKYRINQAKKLLLMHKNVTESCYDTGFENLSHFNRTFKKFAGENPSAFRKRVTAA